MGHYREIQKAPFSAKYGTPMAVGINQEDTEVYIQTVSNLEDRPKLTAGFV